MNLEKKSIRNGLGMLIITVSDKTMCGMVSFNANHTRHAQDPKIHGKPKKRNLLVVCAPCALGMNEECMKT